MPDERHRPRVFSVVGHQNAGKTTLIAKMVAHWRTKGYRVAVIKHDGHADAGADDWEKPGSDTRVYAEAGADMTMVTGGAQTLLRLADDPDSREIARLCQRLVVLSELNGQRLDVILVEGYKRSDLPKVVPVRRREDAAWLRSGAVANVRAVVCSGGLSMLADTPWPVYDEDDVARLCDDLWR